jgi:hypothetical protein
MTGAYVKRVITSQARKKKEGWEVSHDLLGEQVINDLKNPHLGPTAKRSTTPPNTTTLGESSI